jgi:hypothetical protein
MPKSVCLPIKIEALDSQIFPHQSHPLDVLILFARPTSQLSVCPSLCLSQCKSIYPQDDSFTSQFGCLLSSSPINFFMPDSSLCIIWYILLLPPQPSKSPSGKIAEQKKSIIRVEKEQRSFPNLVILGGPSCLTQTNHQNYLFKLFWLSNCLPTLCCTTLAVTPCKRIA